MELVVTKKITLNIDIDPSKCDSFLFFLPGRGQDAREAVDVLRNNMMLEDSMGIIGIDPGEDGFYPAPSPDMTDGLIGHYLIFEIPQIEEVISSFLKTTKVKKTECALMGFSAGAVVSLALSWNYCYGACVLYSGAIFSNDYLNKGSSSHSYRYPKKTPIIDHSYPFLVIHNEDDQVFEKKQRLKPLLKHLEEANASYDAYIRPTGGHRLDADGLKIASIFINSALNKSPLSFA